MSGSETSTIKGSMRDRILSAAFQSIKENGYSGSSTLEIATKAHVSKRDLYALFKTKDDILLACIADRASAIANSLTNLPEPTTRKELLGILREFGFRILRGVSHRDVRTAFRFAIARSGDLPEVGRIIDKNGRRASREVLSHLFRQAVDRKLLRKADIDKMIRAYFGLLWSDLQITLLMGVVNPPAEQEMRELSTEAAENLLAIYGT